MSVGFLLVLVPVPVTVMVVLPLLVLDRRDCNHD
jgi:hypothetical protein